MTRHTERRQLGEIRDERYNATKLKELSSYLTREDDRKLFGLPPLPLPEHERVSETAQGEDTVNSMPVREEPARAVAH